KNTPDHADELLATLDQIPTAPDGTVGTTMPCGTPQPYRMNVRGIAAGIRDGSIKVKKGRNGDLILDSGQPDDEDDEPITVEQAALGIRLVCDQLPLADFDKASKPERESALEMLEVARAKIESAIDKLKANEAHSHGRTGNR